MTYKARRKLEAFLMAYFTREGFSFDNSLISLPIYFEYDDGNKEEYLFSIEDLARRLDEAKIIT
jgi:hypothetical protein